MTDFITGMHSNQLTHNQDPHGDTACMVTNTNDHNISFTCKMKSVQVDLYLYKYDYYQFNLYIYLKQQNALTVIKKEKLLL